MRTLFFDCKNNNALAVNPKAASSTMARAIVAAHWPELDARLTRPHGGGDGTAYPAGLGPDTVRWQGQCPKCDPEGRTTHLLVREPLARFASACSESGIEDVDVALDALESGEPWRDPHLWTQTRLARDGMRLWRFPLDLDVLSGELGLALPLPQITRPGGERPDPVLSEEQTARVLAVYAEDVSLWESIAEPGQTHVGPEPEPVVEPVPQSITRAQFLKQLRRLGVTLEQIEGLIAGSEQLTDDEREDAIIDLRNADPIRWDNATTQAQIAALGMTPEQGAGAFRAAGAR